MAKIPTISRIVTEDFPSDVRPWINKLLGPLNTFMSANVFALTSHLTFTDNILGQENLIDFTYQGTQSLPSYLITMNATVIDVKVCQATENQTTPIAAILSWKITQSNQVQITGITKFSNGVASPLTVGARYQIRVRSTP